MVDADGHLETHAPGLRVGQLPSVRAATVALLPLCCSSSEQEEEEDEEKPQLPAATAAASDASAPPPWRSVTGFSVM